MKYHFFLTFIVLVVGISITATYAGTVYYHIGGTGPSKPPGMDDVYWSEFDASIYGIGSEENDTFLYIGASNIYYQDRMKSVEFKIVSENLRLSHIMDSYGKYYPTPEGDGEMSKTLIKKKDYLNYPESGLKVWCWVSPQPDGEWLKLKIPAGEFVDVDSVKAASQCYKRINEGFSHIKQDAWQHNGSSIRGTEYWYFPETVLIDTSVAPTFSGPIGSGNWSYEWVYYDPFGNPMPQGGVKWVTDGNGVNEFEMYSLGITMEDTADTWYIEYTYNAETGDYIKYYTDCVPEPGTMMLFSIGGLAMIHRRRKK